MWMLVLMWDTISGKDTTTHRLTHLLRPGVAQPDATRCTAPATKPTTDADFYSHSLYDSDLPSIEGGSDVLSESDFASDIESAARGQRVMIGPLSDIASDVDADVETSSAPGDGDGDGDGGGDSDLEQATEALSLGNDDKTPRPSLRARDAARDHHLYANSGSSPSCSPAHRKPRRPSGRVRGKAKQLTNRDSGRRDSFYDYLFK
jgi:hypothetical protein